MPERESSRSQFCREHGFRFQWMSGFQGWWPVDLEMLDWASRESFGWREGGLGVIAR